MFLMMVPLVAVLLGAACGGKPDALLRVPLRWLGLVPIAFAIQWVLVRIPTMDPHPALGVALVASYGTLLAFLLINRRLPGLGLAAAGTLLNLTAIVANGGFMPTTAATLAAAGLERSQMALGQRVLGSKDILLPPGGAVFGWLGDTMTIAWPIPQAFSVGDVLVALGIGTLVFIGMQPRRWWRVAKTGTTGAVKHSLGHGYAAEAQPARGPGRNPTQ
jgi:uncharacterized protein DUF5317